MFRVRPYFALSLIIIVVGLVLVGCAGACSPRTC